jgi:hypothetical protein
LLIRMRSQVQVLAGPPPIPAGHSAAGSEPGTPAAGLGRAGAAPRPRPAPRAAATPMGRRRDHHSPWSPTQPEDGSHAAGAASSRCGLLPCPPRGRQPWALRTPAWPAWSLSRSSAAAAARTHPAKPPAALTDQRAASAASPAPGLPGRRPSRPTARQPPGLDPSRGDGYPMPAWSQRHCPVWEETDASGWGWTPAGWTPAGWTPGGWTPERWTLDGWTADGRIAGPPDDHPGDRTPDGLDPGRPDRWTRDDDTGWVDTRCWTPIGDRCHGRRPGSVDQGDDG